MNPNIFDIRGGEWSPPVPEDGGREPPDNGDMEARVTKLEAIAEKTGDRLAALERDVAVIKSNYATREDVIKSKHEMVFWIVGSAVLSQLIPTLPALLKVFGWAK